MRWVLLSSVVLLTVACKKESKPATSAPSEATEASCSGPECERLCSEKKDPSACAAAAEAYFDGVNGHPLDMAKSFDFATRACDGGSLHGCTLLGFHYQDGLGAPWNPAKAVTIYESACSRGAGTSCYNLAGMYLGGHGVTVDFAKGDHYKKLAGEAWEAACNGKEPRWCTNAAFMLGAEAPAKRLELNKRACDHGTLVGCTQMLGDQFLLKQLDSVEWRTELEKLCQRGEPTACSLAALALRGPGVPPEDVVRSPELLRHGCEIGDKESCVHLARTPGADPGARIGHLSRACDRAAGAACLEIAREHFAAKNMKDAKIFGERACHMGQLEGCGALSMIALTGHAGSPPDKEEGLRWATEACRLSHQPSCGLLVENDRELPMPLDHKRRLLTQACQAKVATSCARLDELRAP